MNADIQSLGVKLVLVIEWKESRTRDENEEEGT
jgi:hypothetical protein